MSGGEPSKAPSGLTPGAFPGACPGDPERPPQTLGEFLDFFLATHREDNFLAVKHGNYTVSREEIMGEALDWTMQYLQYM